MPSMRLLPEWHPQQAVILAWPDDTTDWLTNLEQVQATYLQLIAHINQGGCAVILLVKSPQVVAVQTLLSPSARVLLVEAEYNDTWLRDYGFLTCHSEQGMQPVEFVFNGWGNKFHAGLDDQVNQRYLGELCQLPLISVNKVLEGGALEIDQQGCLLSTQLCLSNPARNGDLAMHDYQQLFAGSLGASDSYILQHGHLEGDDTDGHVDTLVRFAPGQTLVIQTAFNRPHDSHFAGLQALVEECRQCLPEHQIIELPLPEVINQVGERLPASYANYLINNQQILLPVYQQSEDKLALQRVQQAYPQHNVVPINALPLVQQFGSIHCISMQVPTGTLKPEIASQCQQGISLYRGADNA